MPVLFLTSIVTRRPHDAAVTASSVVDHVSGSTIDLQLKLCI